MAGLFDYEDPDTAGRLAMAAGLLSAGGPQLRPVSFGQGIAQGLLAGRQASSEVGANKRRNRLTDLQEERIRAELEQMRRAMNAPPKPDLMSVAPGATVFDKGMQQPVYTAPAQDKPKDQWETLQVPAPNRQGLQRNVVTGELRAIGSGPAAVMNVNTRQEGEEAKAVGKFWGEQYGEIQKSGMTAQGKIARLDRMEGLLKDVETGKLTPLGTDIAGYAASLGLQLDPNLPNKQAAAALANEMALQARSPAAGAGMPGAMSDKDREFLVQTVPGLAQTPQGNRLIIETHRRLAKREAEIAKLANKYRMKHRTLDDGFVEELQAFADANPLFADMQMGGGAGGVTHRYNPATRKLEPVR